MLQHRKVNINDQTMAGTTGLIAACAAGQVEVVKYLLSNKYIRMYVLEDTKVSGRNAFSAACLSGNKEIIDLLLARGFEIDLSRKFYLVSFDEIDYYNEETKQYRFHRQECQSDTGLTAALIAHKYDIAEYLLSKGAKPINSIETISMRFDIEALKYLLDRVEDKITLLNRAYLVACEAVVHDTYANFKYVEYLVDNGVDIVTTLAVDDPYHLRYNRTGLHLACAWRKNPYIGYNELLVKYFLLKNPELYNCKDKSGTTLMCIAHSPTHSFFHSIYRF